MDRRKVTRNPGRRPMAHKPTNSEVTKYIVKSDSVGMVKNGLGDVESLSRPCFAVSA